MKKIKLILDRILYSKNPYCPLCKRPLLFTNELFCPHCENKLTQLPDNRCIRCGKALNKGHTGLCSDCSKDVPICTHGIALYPYDTYSREVIFEIKYHNRTDLGVEMGKLLGSLLKTLTWYENLNIITVVPLHSETLKTRGYNQAHFIGKGVSEITKIPLKSDILIKTKQTQDQIGLGKEARYENMLGTFEVNNSLAVAGKNILLVDDVYTTGATINSCSTVLLASGAKSICFATVASAQFSD